MKKVNKELLEELKLASFRQSTKPEEIDTTVLISKNKN